MYTVIFIFMHLIQKRFNIIYMYLYENFRHIQHYYYYSTYIDNLLKDINNFCFDYNLHVPVFHAFTYRVRTSIFRFILFHVIKQHSIPSTSTEKHVHNKMSDKIKYDSL